MTKIFVLATLLIDIFWPLEAAALSSGPDSQDTCRIGEVSPGEYRKIAEEVAAMPPFDWQEGLEAQDQEDGLSGSFRLRLKQVVENYSGANEKIAAVHALMRSIGAEHTWARAGPTGAAYHSK